MKNIKKIKSDLQTEENSEKIAEYVNKKLGNNLQKQSKSNEDIIRMFLADEFPHDKEEAKNMGFKKWLPEYGTKNLYFKQIEPGKWALFNYQTPLVINDNGTYIFDNSKYSNSTTAIQKSIQNIAQGLGINLTVKGGMNAIKKIKSYLGKKSYNPYDELSDEELQSNNKPDKTTLEIENFVDSKWNGNLSDARERLKKIKNSGLIDDLVYYLDDMYPSDVQLRNWIIKNL